MSFVVGFAAGVIAAVASPKLFKLGQKAYRAFKAWRAAQRVG